MDAINNPTARTVNTLVNSPMGLLFQETKPLAEIVGEFMKIDSIIDENTPANKGKIAQFGV